MVGATENEGPASAGTLPGGSRAEGHSTSRSPREWARRYAAWGISTFPCRPGMKTPATRNGFHDATSDPARLRALFAAPGLNLGIAWPPGIVVLDVDGAEGLATLAALDVDVPATACQETPSGGLHLVFRVVPEGATVRQTEGELGPKLDTRAGGLGYTLGEPSVFAGRPYRWRVLPEPQAIAEAPEWLITALAPRPAGKPASGAPTAWGALLAEVPEGRRNSTLARLAGLLLRRWVPVEVVAELLLALNATRCRPPLPDLEVARVLRSVAKLEGARRRGAN